MSDIENNKRRILYWMNFLLVLVFAFGFSRITFLTVVMGSHYKEVAENNTIKVEKIKQPRGNIYDRNGKQLAINIENNGETKRFYPYGEVLASVLGYIGKIDEQGLKNCKNSECDGETEVGKMGLEKFYQQELVGKPGEMIVEGRASGEPRTQISKNGGSEGKNLTTNIDIDLQTKSFVALKEALKSFGKSGAMVIAKVSGEVLVMASAPSYDNNLFIADGRRSDFGGDYKSVDDLLKDTEKKPLFDRAITGDFAPGSVFKLLPAIAALEEKKIDENFTITDTGEIKIGDFRFGNWYLDKYGRTDGEVNIVKAIARSNDIFFYKAGESVGIDALVNWS